MKKVNIESFLDEYKGVVPDELFRTLAKALLNGKTEIEISDDDYNRTLYLKQQHIEKNRIISKGRP